MQTDNTTRDHKDVLTRHRRDRRAVTTLAGAPNQARSPAFLGALVGTDSGRACLPLPFPSLRGRGREARSAPATRVPSSSKFGAAAAPHAEFGTDHPSRSKSAPEKRDSGVPSRARARIPGIRSATFWPQHDADHRGPARPSSAPLGPLRHPSAPARLPSPQLLSPRPTHLGSGRLRSPRVESAMWTPGAYCKAIRVGSPVASLGRSLCLAPAALPWAPKASGHRPLVLAGPPQGRGGAVSKGGALGAGQGSRRSWTKGPSWSGRRGYSKKARLWKIGCH